MSPEKPSESESLGDPKREERNDKTQVKNHFGGSVKTHLTQVSKIPTEQKLTDPERSIKVSHTNLLTSSSTRNSEIKPTKFSISAERLEEEKRASVTLASSMKAKDYAGQELGKINAESIVKKNVLEVAELNNSLEGKKIVLTIPTSIQIQEDKPGLFKKLGEYNRTGEWPEEEKAKNLWTRIKESTSSDKSTKL